jgi:hypothetical protein
MPYIEGLKLTEFVDIVESPAPPEEGIQGMYIRMGHADPVNLLSYVTDKFRMVNKVSRLEGHPVVTVDIDGREVDVTVTDHDVRLFWFDDRTDSDGKQALSDLEFREATK